MKTNTCCRSPGLRALLLFVWFAVPGEATDLPPTLHEAEARAKTLRTEIARADELYFKKSAPELSDPAYDQLKRELAAIEEAFPELATETAAGIGDDRNGEFPVARHRERMTSLKKSYSEAELRAFHAQVAKRLGRDDFVCVIEPKFDGLAISITYEHGRLVRALTRGNGEAGDDVTANVLALAGLPHSLAGQNSETALNAIPDLIELRGEIYIGFEAFRRLNAQQEKAGEESFAHPRNLASGTLKQHDPALVRARELQVVFYGIGACAPSALRPVSQQALHAAIHAWGLPGVENLRIARSVDEIWQAVKAVGAARIHYAFPTDGAVVKVDDARLQRALGVGPDAPNWAMAYKFAPERVSTRVTAITIQVGRTGVLTPVAELEPVELKGSTIARASLHNRDEIRRRDVRVGDYVFVEKAGEIIPAISGVDRARRPADLPAFVFPDHCPACGAEVVSLPGEAAVRCPNSACPAQLRRRLEYFGGNQGVEIEGLGPATIDALVSSEAIQTIADLYGLQPDNVKMLGRSTGSRLLAAIEQSKRAELWRFVNGLGIPRVGPAAAKALARHFGGLRELSQATKEDLFDGGKPRVRGVSRNAGEAVIAFFAQPANRGIVETMIASGVEPISPK
jgi:DNA ligase (NAD+)